MTYPVAYRTLAAVDKAGPGYQRQPDHTGGPRPVGPWDRPAPAPAGRYPSPGTGIGPYQPPAPANDNARARAFARVGITLLRRANPYLRLWEWLKWLDKIAADSVIYQGVAPNTADWDVLVECNNGGSRMSSAFCNSCCTSTGINETPIQPGQLFARPAFIGVFLYKFTNLGGVKLYDLSRKLGTTAGVIPARAPDIFIPDPRNFPEVPKQDEDIWAQPPAPLPYETLPYVRPNPEAPAPIRRETGPAPDEYAPPYRSPSPAVNPDPFFYPPSPGPDIWIDPLPRNIPGWWRSPYPTPAPAPRPRQVPGTAPQPGVTPTPSPAPGVGPVGRISTGTGPVIAAKPSHAFRPPRAREKETKKQVQGSLVTAYRKFAKGFGQITEASDALDCMYGALPEKLRKREAAKRHGKNPNVKTKLKLIYQHHMELQIDEAIKCMLYEHVEDALIGKANRKHAELRKQYGIRGGYMSSGMRKLPGISLG